MITMYSRVMLSVEVCNDNTSLSIDNLTKNHIYNVNKVIPADKHMNNYYLNVIFEEKLIATTDPRCELPRPSEEFIQEYCSKNGFEFGLIKLYKFGTDSDTKIFINEDSTVELKEYKDNITLKELMNLAKAYPNDTEFGTYIRNEIIR